MDMVEHAAICVRTSRTAQARFPGKVIRETASEKLDAQAVIAKRLIVCQELMGHWHRPGTGAWPNIGRRGRDDPNRWMRHEPGLRQELLDEALLRKGVDG